MNEMIDGELPAGDNILLYSNNDWFFCIHFHIDAIIHATAFDKTVKDVVDWSNTRSTKSRHTFSCQDSIIMKFSQVADTTGPNCCACQAHKIIVSLYQELNTIGLYDQFQQDIVYATL